MTIEIVKPTYPPTGEAPDNYHPYLAGVSIDETTLKNCCVQKAVVTGIDSLITVSLDVGLDSYTNVPIYIHTDCGAREALIEDIEREPLEYFKDAALMFPLPGGIDISTGATVDPEVLVLEYTDPDTDVKSILFVFHILQSVTSVFVDPLNPEIVQDPFVTYRPHTKITITIDEGDPIYAIYDLLEGTFSVVPTYDALDVPLSVSILEPFTDSAISLARIETFLDNAIELLSSDCFQNMSSIKYGDATASQLYLGYVNVAGHPRVGAMAGYGKCFYYPDYGGAGFGQSICYDNQGASGTIIYTGLPTAIGNYESYDFPCNGSLFEHTATYNPPTSNIYTDNFTLKVVCQGTLGSGNNRIESKLISYDDREDPIQRIEISQKVSGEMAQYAYAAYPGYTNHSVTETMDITINGLSLLGSLSFENTFRDDFDIGYSKQTKTGHYGLYDLYRSDYNKAFLYDIYCFWCNSFIVKRTKIEETGKTDIITYGSQEFLFGKRNFIRDGSLAQYSVADAVDNVLVYLSANGMTDGTGLLDPGILTSFIIDTEVFFVPYDIRAGILE